MRWLKNASCKMPCWVLASAVSCCHVASEVVSAADASQPRQPNVVVIVADDLGYGEVTPDGKQPIPTPHIRSLAEQGVCFTNGYVSCPVCSPTRAGLLTGRYQQRFGHEFNPGPPTAADDKFGLPLTEITLANRLKELGYATGMVGKWHLGFRRPYLPTDRGFDEYFGFLGGAHSYLDSAADPNNRILRGSRPVEETSYLTDAFGREAVAFIDRHKAHPFFLYLTFNSVHAPLQGAEKYLARFGHIENERRRTFAAMLSAMDDNVGAVLDKLRSSGLDERTLIFFVSDNGGPTRQTTSRNDPLRGFKTQVLEGGIRVPFMARWNGTLAAGKVIDHPVIALDIVPTAVAAAGGSLGSDHPVDGVNLLPHLTDREGQRPHEALFWRFGAQWAIRKMDWKLVQPLDGPIELHDLSRDIGEEHNLAESKPEVVKELRHEFEQWNAQLKQPLWKRQALAEGANQKAAGKARARRRAAAPSAG